MKKHCITLIVLLYCSFLVSCNGGENRRNNTTGNGDTQNAQPPIDSCEGIGDIADCGNPGGLANIIIGEQDSKKMMIDFINIYRRDKLHNVIEALDSVYWVDANTILGIDNYLKTQTEIIRAWQDQPIVR